jgi:adenosylcobinamide-phosphate synthase
VSAFGPPSAVALLVGAVIADLTLGEPPTALHPVVWMGRVTQLAERRLGGPAAPHPAAPLWQLAGGLVLALALPALFALGAAAALRAGGPFVVVGWALGVWLTKSTFALRALGQAAQAVRAPLAAGDLGEARRHLSALCSRDPASLDGSALAGAAVSSLAENLCDSVVAPLFYFAIAGLPGAMAYRAVNTLDAMIGYRGRYEHFGKAAARLDDLLNFVPARLTALLLLAAGTVLGLDLHGGWRVLRRDGHLTSSPNGGRPMAAAAGLLDVVLDKPGHYRLGAGGQLPVVATIDRAWRLTLLAGVLAAALAFAVVCLRAG